MALKKRLSAMFMDRHQIIYLISIFINCIVMGGFAATFTFQQIGLGTQIYSINLILGCIAGCVYAFISTDMKKKKWVFCHFKAIDVGETVLFTLTESVFMFLYFFVCKFPFVIPALDEPLMDKVLWLFFGWNMFYRITNTIITSIIPGIGDVYEQSLYKNQLDYQNHSNAEMLMDCFGAALGAGVSFLVGDFIKFHPWLIFTLVILDWYTLWSRWQFYFNKKNYAIIKRNFAKDFGDYRRKNK